MYHFQQLFSRFSHSLSVVRIHDEDQPLCVLKVVPPKRSDFVLTTHIPDCEADVLVFDRFDVKS